MSHWLLILEGLERSALSVSLRASAWVYPLVNTLHILGIALLIGPILILDWRLLRQRTTLAAQDSASTRIPVSTLAAVLLPAARSGFALAVLTGLLLFMARPLDYAFHGLFQLKLGFVALALLNILWLHRSGAWCLALAQERADGRVRLACAVSLVCWLLALSLGRLVGYR